jgi:DegV family protein with EDD domain
MIKVFTDSTSYIPKDLQEKYNIKVISLSVSLDNKEYIEAETSNEEFFAHVEASSEFPKSSQPALEEVYDAFKAEIEKGNSIIGVFISSKMSGTFQTACMVRDDLLGKYPDASITLIDSKSNSMQLGLAALAAAEASSDGKELRDVIDAVENTIKRTRFIFIPKNLKYLEKGGRIGKAQALLGNALKLIPILTVIDGETDSMAKVRTFSKATVKLISILKDDIEKFGVEKLVITHINASEQAKELLDNIKEFVNIDVVISNIGPVIGAHVGPGAVGFIYMTQKEHPMNA